MKDFLKWLGVNEKIAKVVVWIAIIMVMLILTNAMLDSIGFPHYRITYKNLKQINISRTFEYLANWFFIILSFYSIVLLIFRVKNYKKIFKYSILYLAFNIIFTTIFTKGATDIFTIAFMIIFAYLYSGRNYKYIIYIIISIVFNILLQSLTYWYKGRFIDYSSVNELTKGLLFIDYFIIMGIIILVKEIYLKRREKNGKKPILDR